MELEGGVAETNQLVNAFLGESMLKKGRGNGESGVFRSEISAEEEVRDQ